MASSSLNSVLLSSSSSLNIPNCCSTPSSTFLSSPIRAFSCSLKPLFTKPKSNFHHKTVFSVKAQTLDFTDSLFGGGFGSEDDGLDSLESGLLGGDVEEKQEPECPPGLRQYESMVLLRPDMSEDERLALTEKYEELLVAGGGMYVEVFNRGIIPLAYWIEKKNKEGETNTYMDGIFLLFTYFTKPESLTALEQTLLTDDNVIRATSFKIKK